MTRKTSLLLILAAIGIGFYWLLTPSQQVDEGHYNNNEQYSPNVESINQQMADKFLKELTSDADDIGPDIDPQEKSTSTNAKLSGAIKAITTDKKPTTKELNVFYQAHKFSYTEAAQFTFVYRVFYTAKYGGQTTTIAKKALQDGIVKGIPLLQNTRLPQDIYVRADSVAIDETFGVGFADKLDALNSDRSLPCWAGPISSKVGAYLICAQDYQPGRVPDLLEIQNEVVNDWRLSL
jgi:hypothetical protein